MRVGSDDDVHARGAQVLSEALLHSGRASEQLGAPVEEHDDGVGRRAGLSHRGEQTFARSAVVGGGDAGLRVGRSPGREQRGVDHPAGAEDGDALPVHRDAVRRVRRCCVRADPDDGELGCADRCERVVEPDCPEVASVVVRHRHDVDAGGGECRERARWGSEGVRLRFGRAAGRDGRLQVHHRDVGLGHDRRHRCEHRRRIRGEPRRGRVFELRVSREHERHRLTAACPRAVVGRQQS